MMKMITKTTRNLTLKVAQITGIILSRIWFCICFCFGFMIGLLKAYIKKEIQSVQQIWAQHKIMKGFKFKTENHFCDFMFEKHIFHVHKNVYMNKLNVYVSCVCGRPFVPIRRISVDDLFIDKFSVNTKLFFLAHEASHILNGDFSFKNMRKVQKTVSKCGSTEQAAIVMAQRQYERELMADRRAALSVGFISARDALKEAYTLFPCEEIISRYEALGGNKKELVNPFKKNN